MCKIFKKNKIFKASDGFNSEDLIKCALDHLVSAKFLFKESPLCYDSAGYLAHLGLELMLKSILLKLNGEFPATHNLKTLYNLVKKSGGCSIKKDEEKALSKINDFFSLRYTNPKNPIEIGSDDWEIIEQSFFNLLNNFPHDFLSKLDDSDHYEKANRILFVKAKETNNPT